MSDWADHWFKSRRQRVDKIRRKQQRGPKGLQCGKAVFVSHPQRDPRVPVLVPEEDFQ